MEYVFLKIRDPVTPPYCNTANHVLQNESNTDNISLAAKII